MQEDKNINLSDYMILECETCRSFISPTGELLIAFKGIVMHISHLDSYTWNGKEVITYGGQTNQN